MDSASTFQGARICVVGVGGGGGNAVDAMIRAGLEGVETVALNTDIQALHRSSARSRFQLGSTLTRGLGAGANPEVGREAALSDRDRIAELLSGADMVFVCAGLGGGTGTGAAPVVAEMARHAGALTVGVATLPFRFEGRRRARLAQDGLEHLRAAVDTLVTIPNERLLSMVNAKTRMADAFAMVDEVVMRGVRGVADLIRGEGRVNVDFADVRTILEGRGPALLSVGQSTGEHRMLEAVQAAIGSPLIHDATLGGARYMLMNVEGPEDLTLFEVHEAATLVHEEANEEVDMIWGWRIEPNLGDAVRVTLLATGFEDAPGSRPPTRPRRAPPEPRKRKKNTEDSYDLPTFFRNAD